MMYFFVKKLVFIDLIPAGAFKLCLMKGNGGVVFGEGRVRIGSEVLGW